MTRLSPLGASCAAVLALAACADSSPPTADPASPEGVWRTPTVAVAGTNTPTAWVAPAPSGTGAALWVRPGADAPPVAVAQGALGAHAQAGARLVALPDGALVAVWVEEQVVEGRRFPASMLRAARSADGGRTWTAPVPVHPDPGFPSSHTFHSAAAGPDGTLYVAWLDGTARDRARRAGPATAPAAGEHPHAPDEPGTDLVVATSRDGGRSFGAPVTVARGTCECCRTALAPSADGSVAVAWRHLFAGGQRDIAVATSRDGGRSFGAPVRVHADGWTLDGCPHAGPALAAGADGLHVVWPTGADGRAGLWHAVSADGGASFGAPVALARGRLGQVRAAAHGGRVWIAWEETARQRVGVVETGLRDTLVVQGTAPDLAAGGGGASVVWLAGGRLATRALR